MNLRKYAIKKKQNPHNHFLKRHQKKASKPLIFILLEGEGGASAWFFEREKETGYTFINTLVLIPSKKVNLFYNDNSPSSNFDSNFLKHLVSRSKFKLSNILNFFEPLVWISQNLILKVHSHLMLSEC